MTDSITDDVRGTFGVFGQAWEGATGAERDQTPNCPVLPADTRFELEAIENRTGLCRVLVTSAQTSIDQHCDKSGRIIGDDGIDSSLDQALPVGLGIGSPWHDL